MDINILNIPNILSAENPIENFFSAIYDAQRIALVRSQALLSVSPKPYLQIFLLDELDALGKQANYASEKGSALSLTLCHWLDHLSIENSGNNASPKFLRPLVVGTTNRPCDIFPSLRRGGRFEKGIEIVESSWEDRSKILFEYFQQRLILKEVDIDELHTLCEQFAQQTGGFVAADIVALLNETIRELRCQDATLQIKDIKEVLLRKKEKLEPSILRGTTLDIAGISFDEVAGYETVKAALKKHFSYCDLTLTEKFRKLGISKIPGGVLLHGPPGNSKTRIIVAVCNEYKLPLITLTAADVYSAYVGDAEAAIRKGFTRARQAAPCLLFFDEIDAIVTDRQNESGNSVESRVLASLLNEMDGIDTAAASIFVVAATNRLDSLDSALTRKGRFHLIVEMHLPNLEERLVILKYFVSKYHLEDSDFRTLSKSLKGGMSGANIENMCREARMLKLRKFIVFAQQYKE